MRSFLPPDRVKPTGSSGPPIEFSAWVLELVAADSRWLSDAAWRRAFGELVRAVERLAEDPKIVLSDATHEKLLKVVETMSWPSGRLKASCLPFVDAIADAVEPAPEAK